MWIFHFFSYVCCKRDKKESYFEQRHNERKCTIELKLMPECQKIKESGLCTHQKKNETRRHFFVWSYFSFVLIRTFAIDKNLFGTEEENEVYISSMTMATLFQLSEGTSCLLVWVNTDLIFRWHVWMLHYLADKFIRVKIILSYHYYHAWQQDRLKTYYYWWRKKKTHKSRSRIIQYFTKANYFQL